MKLQQPYLVAKYVPDVRRMEPHNIGVILWAAGSVQSMFLPPEQATFVNERKTYTRWIEFWERLLSQDEVSIRGGTPVSRKNPAFIDAIQTTQKGNYLLFQAGQVEERVRREELPVACKFLYDQLVAIPVPDEQQESKSLAKTAVQLFKDSGLADRIKPKYPVPCRVLDAEQELTFSYAALDGGALQALFQRVALTKQESVTSSAFKFEWVRNSNTVRPEACNTIVSVSDAMRQDYRVDSHYRLLEKVSTVLNVAHYDDAVKKARRIAA